MGYSPWGLKESVTTRRLHFTSLQAVASCKNSHNTLQFCLLREVLFPILSMLAGLVTYFGQKNMAELILSFLTLGLRRLSLLHL